jgi:hypothetical protein
MANDLTKESEAPVVRYFHGGNRGLKVGEYVLPSSETGGESASEFGTQKVHRKGSYAATREPLQHRIFQQSRGILGGDFLGTQLAANSEDFGQPAGCRRQSRRAARRHDGEERRDHAGIEWIVLGENPACPGGLPQLERIDLAHGQVGCEQGPHDATLVASARLDPDRCDRGAAQLLDQLGPTDGVIAYRRALLLGQDHDVQTIFRHIDTAKRERCHLRIPFLLMRARAQATVRVWKKRLELQAHVRFTNRGDCGLPVATGVRS